MDFVRTNYWDRRLSSVHGEWHWPPPPTPNGNQLTHDTTMTLWHASTELHTTAETAVVAKTLYLAAGLTGALESGRGLELDTSG